MNRERESNKLHIKLTTQIHTKSNATNWTAVNKQTKKRQTKQKHKATTQIHKHIRRQSKHHHKIPTHKNSRSKETFTRLARVIQTSSVNPKSITERNN